MDDLEDHRPDDPADEPLPRPTRRRFLALAAAFVALVAGVVAFGRSLLSRLPPVELPPSNYLGDFKVNSVEPTTPAFDEATWRLVVDGLVERPAKLAFSELSELPVTRMTADFRCVEGWSVEDVRWEGVRVSELLSRVRPQERGTTVIFHASGGVYADAIPIEDALDPRALLAFRMDGAPLEPRQGRPLRLVLPWMYGYKGPKWVERVELTDRPFTGYWEQRGYPADADLPG
jgi:DMSO/TMAO reductase YedYZ molybdopterin-dependent catalytic subunit